MPLRGAIASGNWSNPAIWNGGVLPAAGDIVASNNFTVTIDVNINVDSITNTAQTDPGLTATMTSNTTPSGVVSASTILSTSYPAWQAFDKNNSTAWASSTSGPPQWLEYEFPSPTVVNRYVLRATSTDAPVTWDFQAWNGSTWVTLQSIVNAPKVGTDTTYNFTNTTAYTKYRMFMLAPYSQGYMLIHELTLANSSALASSVAGGTFILNNGVTVTCTGGNGIYAGNVTCLTYAGTGTSTINANINALTVTPGSYTYTLVHSGTGILNINGTLNPSFTCLNRGCLTLTGSGTLNLVGSIGGGFCNTPNVSVTTSGKLNVVGDISGGSNVAALELSGTSVTTVTGTLNGGSNSGRAIVINANALLTVTGNLLHGGDSGPAIIIPSGNPNVTITGNVGSTFANSTTLLTSAAGSYIKVIGTIFAGLNYNFYSVSPSSINILTGPFISYATGIHPFWVSRIHYQRTFGSYLEFRDNSTNGALPPAVSAPATKLVSPDTVADSPIPANVRQGTVYSLGSQTGTMIVPSPSNVANNVPVDNTVGTAVLDPTAIWAVPLTSINTLNSIGRRVKNAATVETTGAQIQTTLNNNE
jgi:hypothetical protein